MKRILMIVIGLMILLVGGYFAGQQYFANRFTPNTEFASVKIGNLSLEDASDKVASDILQRQITLKENQKDIATFKVEDLKPALNYKEDLQALFQQRNVKEWPLSFLRGVKAEAGTKDILSIETSSIESVLEEQNILENRQESEPYRIEHNDKEGFHAIKGKDGDTIDQEKLNQLILDTIESNQDKIDVKEAYETSDSVTDHEALDKKLSQYNNVSKQTITYLMAGEEVTIPQEKVQKWVSVSKDKKPVVDQEKIKTYLDVLNEKYGTFGRAHDFLSTNQGWVTVPPGILGWAIDTEAESAQLAKEMLSGQDIKREPVFYSVGNRPGQVDEIGSTYVEVDLTYQKMYVYLEGELLVATDIVSGNPNNNTATTPGANAIIEKLADTNLVGYSPVQKKDYSLPVDYWMRFDYYAQGIHDAPWLSAFGGGVYQSMGSLGCINTPLWAMEIIYHNIPLGTPVMVFN